MFKCKEYKLNFFIRRFIVTFILDAGIILIIKESIWFFLAIYIFVIIFFPIFNKEMLINKIKKQLKYKTYKFSVSLDDNGIEYATFDYRVKANWSSVTGIVETDRYLHVYCDSKEEIFIPKKAFINVDDLKNFIQKLNNMMCGHNQKELKGSE